MTVLTLDDVHRLHPWPARHGAAPSIEFLWQFELAAAPADVWRATADTSRLNRALGTAEMHFTERDGQRFGASTSGGRAHRWLEPPWSWVAGEWLECVRLYDRGYPRAMHAIQRVDPHGTGTRYTAYFGFVPRGALGRLALKLGFGGLERPYRKVMAELDRQLTALAPALLPVAAPALAPATLARIASIRAELAGKGLERAAVDRLCDFVAAADDLEVGRIQVRERARAWGLDEERLLAVFLHATRAGLLALSWDVVCPHCRGSEGVPALDALPTAARCETCQLDFGTDRDNAIEITFRVHRSIREVPERHFCSAEPARKDHIRLQRVVAPGEAAELAPTLAPRRYRARVEGEERYGYLDVGADGAAAVEWRASAGAGARAVAATPRLRLANDRTADAVFIVEEAAWSDVALRPGRLLSFQEFRDLFSEEYLGTDVQLAIGEQTILFTDMVGSTNLYATRGDPGAFVEVRRHFAVLFELVRAHRGAVVKTIGDAVMAAFGDPLDAVVCSKAIHDRFPPGCADSVAVLRISLNTGPCIAVRLNANIDYFGSTVNVAAKLQALAEAWQIAMSKATYEAPGVAAWLRDQGATLEDDAYASPALPAPVAARRWTVHRAPG
ncbi:MAG: adenylate/guanylate cyclase domain-containing protein [Kofleriaceae bacterium]|nr:adenylate/guanylate cyclase domain-containing protein [Kofleriaceae bacterium]